MPMQPHLKHWINYGPHNKDTNVQKYFFAITFNNNKKITAQIRFAALRYGKYWLFLCDALSQRGLS